MTTDQLDSGIAFISYGDGISEHEAIIGLIRLLGQIIYFSDDFYSVFIIFFHHGITHHFVRYDKADRLTVGCSLFLSGRVMFNHFVFSA